MALDRCGLSELLDAFQRGDGVDLVPDAVRLVRQELIEAEAAEAIGARHFDRTPERVTGRNRHRARVLSTKAGDVDVDVDVAIAIAKLRRRIGVPKTGRSK